MPDVSTLLLFAAASAVLIAVPGPAMAYIVARAVTQGRSAGVVSALGIEVGALVHVAAAVVGLSALIASSATAFAVVKYAGAAYLVVLGIQKLRSGARAAEPGAVTPETRGQLFRRGVLVNALNPKVAVFFLAFLPQFVDPHGAPVALQVALLGILFVAIAAAIDCAWALAAGSLGVLVRGSDRFRRWMDRVSGVTFLGMGAAAALARR